MFTLYGTQQVFSQVLKISSSSYDSCYLALSTTEPTINNSNVTEPVGNGYARISISKFMAAPALSSDSTVTEITNNKEIHFNEATGNWGTITHFALYTSSTGGTPLYVGALTQAITPTANTVPLIKVGQLKITLK